jgi:hypothetical protein
VDAAYRRVMAAALAVDHWTPADLAADEPLSPELVLVTPELRATAIGVLPPQADVLSLPARPAPQPLPGEGEAEPAQDGARPRLARLLLVYAAWQLLVGAVFGAATFAAFTALVVVVSLVAH